ncbi:MAG: polysaccharide deacetylase family protein [Candidatus Eisenbacteria bacterium]|nr:polysaccharide deacetylase family protein [Candidatus Eisenbacteria bacterium]
MPRFPHRAAFSFDIEDWHHSEINKVGEVHASESIVERGTNAILDLLAKHGWRSTFFVLGDVVREHPELIRRMVREGHELACHGMSHRPVWRATPETFRAELREFRTTVEGVLGDFPVTGFRAPTFSIDRSNAWALDVLADEGYRYDSSIFPMKVKMYGTPGAPVGLYRPSRADLRKHDPAGRLVEFPVAIAEVMGVRFPVGGGFYLRALPLPLFRAGLDFILQHRPFVLYLHPREVTPESRRMPLDPVNGFITYVNLDTVIAKLEHLFQRYEWTTMRDILNDEGWLR